MLNTLLRYTSKQGALIVLKFQSSLYFELRIVASRKTKLGDYRYNRITDAHQITINNDLKGDAFLFTMLHEIAHQHTQVKHGSAVQPHGEEWKNCYRELLLLALRQDAFENSHLIIESVNHLKSSSTYNPAIYKTLYSQKKQHEWFLEDLADGMRFKLGGRMFFKVKKNRTRCLCQEITSGKQFTISNLAPVTPLFE